MPQTHTDRLTPTQRHYLTMLKSRGRIQSGPSFPSTITARLLQERGLAELTQRGPGSWTLTAITDRGRAALDANGAEPKMSKMITVRMDPDLHAKVMEKAHAKGRDFSVSEMLRKSLEKWVAKP